METLSKKEMCSINGGSEVSHFLIKWISYMFYSEAKVCMEASENGGNVAAVIAFK